MKHKLLFRRFFASLLLLAVSTLSWAYDFEVNGIYYNITDGNNVAVTNNGNNSYSGTVVIPSSVEYNEQNYVVTSIGNNAFSGCSGLTSITIPNSVTSIGWSAFSECSGLTSVIIPNSVTSIGSDAFRFCSGLTSVTIPESITSIGYGAFNGCISLPVVDNIRYADTYLVVVADKTLSTYSIKSGTRFIGSSAFSNCSSLTSITIPNSVTSIGDYSFNDCSCLTSITIPNGVTSIRQYAFHDCSNLTFVHVYNSEPVSISSDVFSNRANATLYVPQGSKATYEAADYWKEFKSIIEEDPQEPIYIETDLTGQFPIDWEGWSGATGYVGWAAPQVTTNDGRQTPACERFDGSKATTGVVFNRTLTGLTNGIYRIELYGAAASTKGRDTNIDSDMTAADEGDETAVYLYARTASGTVKQYIPVHWATNFNSSGIATATLNGVEVTDGTIEIGMYGEKKFANWEVIQIKGVTALVDAEELHSNTLNRAQTAIDDEAYVNVTGEERPALQQAIADNTTVSERTAAAYQSAITALENATKTFTEAKASYDGLAATKTMVEAYSYPYATESKKSAAEGAVAAVATSAADAVSKTEALLTAYRQYAESSALLEGVDGAVDVTATYIRNSKAEEAIDASIWKTVLGEGSGGSIGILDNEPWTDGNGSTSHKYFDGGNWNASAWDVTFKQEITLPVGRYQLTAVGRSSQDVTLTLFAGETTAEMAHLNATGGLFNRGWEQSSVEFELAEEATISIGVKGVTNMSHNWMSFSEFRLAKQPTLATSVTLDKTKLELYRFSSTQLNATVLPENTTDKSVIWTSSNPSVATVSETGLVTAVAAGSATITATTTDGSNLSSSCAVTVDEIILSGECGQNVNYELHADGRLLIWGSGEMTDYNTPGAVPWSAYCDNITSVVIANGVTSIGSAAFYNCSALSSVIIPNGVTNIDADAFCNCFTLTSVTIPNGMTSIGDRAFAGCSSLTSINIPESVTSISDAAFIDCTSLPVIDNISYADTYLVEAWDKTQSTYNIKAGTRFIGASAFSYCSSLTSVTIPESVTSIGQDAFSGCAGLTSVTIPEGVTSIGSSAFADCSSLTSINIPNSVTSIGDNAFRWCSGLTSVTIGNGVTKIGDDAFIGCSGLTSVIIPNSVTSIGYFAFSGCSSLTSINIPESVTSIGSSAFADCSGLASICVDTDNSVYDSRNDCNAIIETATNTLTTGCKNTVIPESVTSIGNSAFNACAGLTSVTIPESVTNIGYYAFSGCSGLTSINIPNSVTSIGNSAFNGCAGLTSVTIPESVTSIGWGAFGNCSGLTSIHVYNNNPVSISSSVFSNRANATLYVPKGAKAAYEAADYWKEFKEIVERPTVDVTLSAVGTRTFCSSYDLDFSEVSGLKAYIISGFSPSTGTLTLTPVTHVPSGTGLLLQGEPGDYDVPVLETDMYYTNLLKGVTEATVISPTEGEYTNFILANGAHGIGFYTLSESGELAAGKAYLQIPTSELSEGSEARCFILDFENGDATGIGFTRVTTPKEDGVYYDLMGRRVKKPTKGIYIFNGKKVLIK